MIAADPPNVKWKCGPWYLFSVALRAKASFPSWTLVWQFSFKNVIAINLHCTDELKSVVFVNPQRAFFETSEQSLVYFSLRLHNKQASFRVKNTKPL